jgi:GH35 family endo-1,4-beta-xylanase
MLRFSVQDSGDALKDWSPVGAHLIGPDDVAVEGKISFKHHVISCRKRSSRAAGLSVQYDTGRMGSLMLQTCLLPDREEPYILSVELARHRIKMFIAKSEEWQMFDLSAGHPAMRHWEKARALLTDALTTPDAAAADAAAREALCQAVEASERLAMAHAEVLLHRRFATRPAASSTLGVRVGGGAESAYPKPTIAQNFDLIVIPFRWRDVEIEEGKFNWEPIDQWMEWARKEGKPIIAGPLLDFSKEAIPDWMYVWQHDYDTCRDLVYEYMEQVVHRYRAVVGMWILSSGLAVNDNFEFSATQMMDLTRTANLLVRHARKGARTMVELREPFGEYGARKHESLAPLVFVDRMMQEGIKVDALGVQLLFGEHDKGRTTRDLAQISSMLDRFFLCELPILVSAMGVPSETHDAQGGSWHEPWTEDLQARWVARMFAVAMSKPFVESIFWTDLVDFDQAQPMAGGLITHNGVPKSALARLTSMRKRLRKPLGPLKLPQKQT